MNDIYFFKVHAIEISTKEKFNNSTNVTIFIKDINDNSPKFAKNFFEFEVEEEVMAPVFISQVCILLLNLFIIFHVSSYIHSFLSISV